MIIPTEPIGSLPRPRALLEGIRAFQEGRVSKEEMDSLYDIAVRDAVRDLEATGSSVISDGEQAKPSFATYPLHGLGNLAPDGATIPFSDGHVRQLPRLTAGPFRYATYADAYLAAAQRHAKAPVKQAVISASALSLIYPPGGLAGYPQGAFIDDLLREHETDIRRCLERNAHTVQIDFTEGRLALKLDPSGQLLKSFIELNNRVLDRFSAEQRSRIGVHTCPGGDRDATHSADIDYAELLPELFRLKAGKFYIQLASEPNRARVLQMVRQHAKQEQRIFVGVIDPINARVETPQEVRDRVLEAARYIAPERLGTTDDCGFAPFSDDESTPRETALEKIRARVAGTALAAQMLDR